MRHWPAREHPQELSAGLEKRCRVPRALAGGCGSRRDWSAAAQTGPALPIRVSTYLASLSGERTLSTRYRPLVVRRRLCGTAGPKDWAVCQLLPAPCYITHVHGGREGWKGGHRAWERCPVVWLHGIGQDDLFRMSQGRVSAAWPADGLRKDTVFVLERKPLYSGSRPASRNMSVRDSLM